jgi:hypothetical protein
MSRSALALLLALLAGCSAPAPRARPGPPPPAEGEPAARATPQVEPADRSIVYECQSDVPALAFVPGDANLLAVAGTFDVELVDVARGAVVVKYGLYPNGGGRMGGEQSCALAFAPGGESLAVTGDQMPLRVFATKTGEQRWETPPDLLGGSGGAAAGWTSEGEVVVLGGGQVHVLAPDGSPRSVWPAHPADDELVSALTVGDHGLYAARSTDDSQDYTVFDVSAADGQELQRLRLPLGRFQSALKALGWVDDLLVVAGGDFVAGVYTNDEELRWKLWVSPACVCLPPPGCGLLAVTGWGATGEVDLVSCATGAVTARLRTGAERVTAMAFSSEGKRLAVGDASGRVRVLDVAAD